MRGLFGFMLTAGGVAVLVWLFLRRRRVVAAFGRPDLAMALIAFGVVTNLAAAAGASLESPIIGLSVLSLLVWAATLGYREGPPYRLGPSDVWLRRAWLMMGVLLVWSVAIDLIVRPGIYGPRPIAYISAGLFWLAVGLFANRAAISVLAAAYWGLIILAVLSVPAVFASDFWRDCTSGALEKCSLADGLFRSFYDSENYIAIVASVTLVACICSMRRRDLFAASAFCVLIIVATGSRTSLLAVVAVAGWRLGAFFLERRWQFFRLPLAVSIGLPAASASVAIYLMTTANRSTLSNRGNIWITAREYVGERILTGVGVSKWYLVRDLKLAPHHFFHSGYVLVVFAGGVIGLALWVTWAAMLLRGVATDGLAFTAKAPMVLFLVYSLTEVIWNPLSTDGLSWIVVALLLINHVGAWEQVSRAGPVRGRHRSARMRR